jgi:hypothetical protein
MTDGEKGDKEGEEAKPAEPAANPRVIEGEVVRDPEKPKV